ncbi:MAG TPA: hypothetical protein VFB80_01110 [Pirellulaceae bacterium]|nr:hypothetical protein [Pirellulaceae bacterium]
MSIGSLGIVGGLAATPVSQRAAEADKTQQATTEQTRSADAAEQAELAAGIGQTSEDSEAADRDADGRRLWERPPQQKPPAESPPAGPLAAPVAKDPSGACGGQLDLVG